MLRVSEFGLVVAELVARTGLTAGEIGAISADPRIVTQNEPKAWLCDAERWEALRAGVRSAAAAFHEEHPLEAGLPKEALRARLFARAPAFLLDAVLAGLPGVVADGETVRLASHRLQFSPEEERAIAAIEGAYARAELAVPPVEEVLNGLGVRPPEARKLLDILIKQGRLIRVSNEFIFHQEAIARLIESLGQRQGQRFKVPEFKDWTGVSRKYAIPLLEYLDRVRVTRRSGDWRLVV